MRSVKMEAEKLEGRLPSILMANACARERQRNGKLIFMRTANYSLKNF